MPNKLPFQLASPSSKIDSDKIQDFWNLIYKDKFIENLALFPDELKGGVDTNETYDIRDKIFSNISFSRTIVSNLTFTNCAFENCIFIRATFDELEFHSCSFENCNFGKCRIKNTYIDPVSFSKCLNKKNDANIGIHLFQQLMRNFKDLDQPDFYRGAEYEFRLFQRAEIWYKLEKNQINRCHGYSKIFKNLLNQWCFGYGIKIEYFVFATSFMFVFFLLMNQFLWGYFGLNVLCDKCERGSWDTSIYYTAVSLSNLGYGDIVPGNTAGKLWASLQAIVGAVWFAIMASIAYRKISSR